MTDGMARGFGWARGAAVVLMAAALGWGCSSSTQTTAPRPDAAADVPARSDALIDRKTEIPDSAQPTPPANVLFPDPPHLTCARDSDCEFPAPACANPGCEDGGCLGLWWIVYYDNPRCTAGSCVFDPRYFQCTGQTACFGGGCVFNGTAAP